MRKRVAEILHIVDQDKDTILKNLMKPSKQVREIMWLHGIRRQYFFELGDSYIYTFEYHGLHFKEDMDALTAVFASNNMLVSTRLRDTKPEDRDTTNWWAPLKKVAANLLKNPLPDDLDEEELEAQLRVMVSNSDSVTADTAFDEDDWSETIRV